MKIAISGAHSTGKTTLVECLKKDPMFKDYTFITNLTRNIKKDGYVINENAGNRTQMKVIEVAEDVVNRSGNIIADRCILDAYVYTYVLHKRGSVEYYVMNWSREVYYLNRHKYDVIFLVDANIPLVDDGIRSTDIEFRNQVIEKFNELADNKPNNIVKISGFNEQRISDIKKYLNI